MYYLLTWLTDWLTYWLTDWLTNWQADWLTYCLLTYFHTYLVTYIYLLRISSMLRILVWIIREHQGSFFILTFQFQYPRLVLLNTNYLKKLYFKNKIKFLTLFHLNMFLKLKNIHDAPIFEPMAINKNSIQSLNGNISASKKDINNPKTTPWCRNTGHSIWIHYVKWLKSG